MSIKDVLIPVSEGGASGEQDSFGFGQRLVEQTEEGVVLHTDLPEDFTLVSTGHHELQSVLVGTLKTHRETDNQIQIQRHHTH